MHRTLFLSCGLLLAACGGSSKPAAAPAPTTAETQKSRCRALIEKTLSLPGNDLFANVPEDRRPALRARFVDTMVTSCSEDAWTEEMLACGEKATDAAAVDACSPLMNEERQEKAAKRLQPVWKDLAAATSDEPEATPAREATRPGAAVTANGIAACDEYVAVFETYMACDEVPQTARDVAPESLASMRAGWEQFKDPNVPVSARNEAAAACEQGAEALRASAQALGCDLAATAKAETKMSASAKKSKKGKAARQPKK